MSMGIGKWMASFFLVAGIAACVTSDDGKKSAPEHRAEANRHRAEARDALEGYDPGQKEVRVDPKSGAERTGPMDTAPDSTSFPVEAYNPTSTQLKLAEKLLDHVRHHEAAAQKLENAARSACAAFPEETRYASPLVGNLTEVADIEKGVRLKFRKDLPLDAVFAHIQCHLALARAEGYASIPDCPLFVRGVRAAKQDDAVDLIADDPAAEKELRALAYGAYDASEGQPSP
jgi:hypothetical protein